MEKNSFVKGAAILAVAGLIVKFIGAVYRVPLGNTLGVQGMEYYEVVYPFYSALLVISSAGLPTAISKLVSARVTLGDYRGANRVFRMSLMLLLVIGLVTGLLMFVGANALAGMTTLPDSALSFRALAPALLFVSVMCAYRGYLQGLQRMTGTALSQVIEQVGKLGIGLVLAIRWLPKGPQYAAMGALIGVTASEFLALIVIMLFYWRNNKRSKHRNKRSVERYNVWPVLGGLLAVAIPVTIGAAIMPITGIVDVAMIKPTLMEIGFSTQVAGAAFTILRSYVTPLINMPAVLTMALAMSLVPAISSRMAKKDYEGVRSASRTGLKLALAVGVPCAAGLFVLGRPIIHLLFSSLNDAQLDLAADIMRTASIGVIFLSLVQSVTGMIQGLGTPIVPVLNLVFGAILKIITMVILMRIPAVNIQGAAIGTVVCYAAAGIADVAFLMRKTHIRAKLWDLFGKPIAASVVMALFVYLAYRVLGSILSDGIAAIGAVIVGVVVYLVMVIVLRMFSDADMAFMPGGKKLSRLLVRGRKKRSRA